jgi:hypothetical protein
VHRLDQALDALQQALSSPPRLEHPWRQIVHDRLAVLVDELTAEQTVAADTWLTARAGRLQRERDAIMARLTVLSTMLAEHPDLEQVRAGLQRLVHDVAHHHARADDLVYDGAGLDVGGSD